MAKIFLCKHEAPTMMCETFAFQQQSQMEEHHEEFNGEKNNKLK